MKPFLNGSANANEYLLNIELEYKANEGPTYEQLDSCAMYVVDEGFRYGWRWPYMIFGHYGVAAPLGRKTDPYLLDWGALMGRLYYWAKQANVAGL